MASPKNELLPDDAPSKKVVLLEESPRKKLPGDTPSKKALLLEDTPTKAEFIPEDTPEKKENEMMKDKVYDDEDEDYDDSNLPEKTRHPFDTSLKLFPLHAWLYILYIVLAILLPIFGTLLIVCGNYTNTGYFSLFAILNYPWPKLKLEDPNATATSLELLQVGAILVLSRESKNSKICSFPHIDLVFWSLLQFKGYIYLNLSFYFNFASTFMSPDTFSSTFSSTMPVKENTFSIVVAFFPLTYEALTGYSQWLFISS